MAINVNKTLYIGIGGTGAQTLVRIKRHFIDAYGEIPQPMIGFLAIDTQDGITDVAVAKAGSDATGSTYSIVNGKITDESEFGAKDVKLAPNEVKCVSVTNALTVYNSNPTEFAWMPQPPKTNVDCLSTIKGIGAGQVRSSGCFIARYNQNEIKERVSMSLNAIGAPIAPDSKYELGKGKLPGIPARTTINVICSVSGGTGSGMLIDVLKQINSAVKATGAQCDIIPWIVMPDVYKVMTPNGSFNVFYNTYGTLRDLDFIYQTGTSTPIPFGDENIEGRLFEYAYIINNVNTAGLAFGSINDLLDGVAKCAFLPSGDMGNAADVMKDNVITHIPDFALGGKQAWAASVGAAEMIYDSKVVGLATAYAIAARLSSQLVNTNAVGSELCNNFVDREDVKIRETGGDLHNDVIDAICDLNANTPFSIEKETSAEDVIGRLRMCSEDSMPEANYSAKLQKTLSLLEKEITRLVCSGDKGGIGAAVSFLAALNGFIDSCLAEMRDETVNLENVLKLTPDWDKEIKGCHGFFGMFKQNAADDLQDVVNNRMRYMQDLKRHQLAIQFYTALKEVAAQYKQQLDAKSEETRKLSQDFEAEVAKIRNSCTPKSKFQIYLHTDAISRIAPNISQQMWNDFCASAVMPQIGNLDKWLKASPDMFRRAIMLFAGATEPVSRALGTTIEDVLASMGTEALVRRTKYVLELSLPMWTINYQGKTTQNVSRARQILVGVPDQSKSIMQTAEVQAALTYDTVKPEYATTRQKDRVYIMMCESSSPIFAINNFIVYEREYKERMQEEHGISCSIDAKMDALREAKGYSFWPADKPSVSLDLWTQAFCFNDTDGQPIIRFDKEKRRYWMRSRTYGEPIENYRYDLGEQRTDANAQFSALKLFDEVKEKINEIVREKGQKYVNDRLDEVRKDNKYYTDCVAPNMNPAEIDGITNGNPAYQQVISQINLEIDLRTSYNK